MIYTCSCMTYEPHTCEGEISINVAVVTLRTENAQPPNYKSRSLKADLSELQSLISQTMAAGFSVGYPHMTGEVILQITRKSIL